MATSHARANANAQTRADRELAKTADLLRDSLTHAVTRHDRAQARGRYYNPNALGLYLARVDEVVADYRRGMTVQAAVEAGFSDRLLDRILLHMQREGWPVAPRVEAGGA